MEIVLDSIDCRLCKSHISEKTGILTIFLMPVI